ncbi:hypothetical protein AG1IA_01880 [Rhizoctonia solani AG-1 IA]|uniref:Uncharacterized protein n=1 Tax=Thanatephorus cucumeris (strain AG1-IA) TaxID=983506 RepID=L8X4Q7_THACA|nr:hypothetical protein AG1IA_01880 [Rhizoctonia solani AG-1 IA]
MNTLKYQVSKLQERVTSGHTPVQPQIGYVGFDSDGFEGVYGQQACRPKIRGKALSHEWKESTRPRPGANPPNVHLSQAPKSIYSRRHEYPWCDLCSKRRGHVWHHRAARVIPEASRGYMHRIITQRHRIKRA